MDKSHSVMLMMTLNWLEAKLQRLQCVQNDMNARAFSCCICCVAKTGKLP